jgi:hypothetical protein
MQIEFTKDALTVVGKVLKGQTLVLREELAKTYVEAGFAKYRTAKKAAKTKKVKV